MDGEDVPVYFSAEEAVDRLTSTGAFEGCVWGRHQGAVCGRDTDWIVEFSGDVFNRTIGWIPACDAHADDLGHWASGALVWRGSYTLIRLEVLPRRTSYRHQFGHATSLMVFPGVSESERHPAAPPLDGASPLSALGAGDTAATGNTSYGPAVFVGNREFTRSIRPATPLSANVAPGTAAEVATYGAAALWGMSDFVFRAAQQHKGSGVREVGDTLIVLDGAGIVLQVKRRLAVTSDPEREERWIRKAAVKAVKQVQGSIRTIRTAKVEVVSGRGETVTLDHDQRDWIGVVVIDHDDIPANVTLDFSGDRTLALSRRDWEFLFTRFKSTHGVHRYLSTRLEQSGAWDLDREADRVLTAPSELASGGEGSGASNGAHATAGQVGHIGDDWLWPADSQDVEAATFYRSLMEDAAIQPADWVTRFTFLNLLDSLPLTARVVLARAILEKLHKARRWRYRVRLRAWFIPFTVSTNYPQFAVTIVSRPSRDFDEMFHGFALFVHESLAPASVAGVVNTIGMGVVSLPREPIGWQVSLGLLNHARSHEAMGARTPS